MSTVLYDCYGEKAKNFQIHTFILIDEKNTRYFCTGRDGKEFVVSKIATALSNLDLIMAERANLLSIAQTRLGSVRTVPRWHQLQSQGNYSRTVIVI